MRIRTTPTNLFYLSKRFNKAFAASSVILVILLGVPMMITTTTINEVYASHTLGGSYVVDIIPGAAQQDSLYHYYPPLIAVPKGTEVAWFNGDDGQPHTVTSGFPEGQDIGMLFNSGVMPYPYFFHYEFEEAGDYPYHCIIHPWRLGVVHVNDELITGNNFEFSSGTGMSWNLSEFNRNLLKFEPTTAMPVGSVLPFSTETASANYYVTMSPKDTNATLFNGYFSSGENLLLELIQSTDSNMTTPTIWGPDRGSVEHSIRGAYHVEGNLVEPGSTYVINIVLTSVDGRLLDTFPIDRFEISVTE